MSGQSTEPQEADLNNLAEKLHGEIVKDRTKPHEVIDAFLEARNLKLSEEQKKSILGRVYMMKSKEIDPKRNPETGTKTKDNKEAIRAMLDDYLGEIAREQGGSLEGDSMDIKESRAVIPNMRLTPRTLMYFDIARGKGFKGTITDFLDECVHDRFKARGKIVAYVDYESDGS